MGGDPLDEVAFGTFLNCRLEMILPMGLSRPSSLIAILVPDQNAPNITRLAGILAWSTH